jgi:hypothetical protein
MHLTKGMAGTANKGDLTMTKWMIAILATALTLAFAPTAWAGCTSHTIMTGTRTIFCTTCCSYGTCTTTCL